MINWSSSRQSKNGEQSTTISTYFSQCKTTWAEFTLRPTLENTWSNFSFKWFLIAEDLKKERRFRMRKRIDNYEIKWTMYSIIGKNMFRGWKKGCFLKILPGVISICFPMTSICVICRLLALLKFKFPREEGIGRKGLKKAFPTSIEAKTNRKWNDFIFMSLSGVSWGISIHNLKMLKYNDLFRNQCTTNWLEQNILLRVNQQQQSPFMSTKNIHMDIQKK